MLRNVVLSEYSRRRKLLETATLLMRHCKLLSAHKLRVIGIDSISYRLFFCKITFCIKLYAFLSISTSRNVQCNFIQLKNTYIEELLNTFANILEFLWKFDFNIWILPCEVIFASYKFSNIQLKKMYFEYSSKYETTLRVCYRIDTRLKPAPRIVTAISQGSISCRSFPVHKSNDFRSLAFCLESSFFCYFAWLSQSSWLHETFAFYVFIKCQCPCLNWH